VRWTLLADNAEISVKPSNWTGLRDQEDAQFAGIKAARIYDVHWAGITARNALFAKAHIVRVRWPLAFLSGSDFRDAKLFMDIAWYGAYTQCIFADDPGPDPINKTPTWEDRRKLHAASFNHCDFSHSLFFNARLAFVDFTTTNLTEADFDAADLRGVLFINCRLKAALFGVAKLQRSTFISCDLPKASFLSTDAQDVEFGSCSLKRADFEGAKLQRSTFIDCDLAEANFEKADLEGADLTKAKGLKSQQLLEAASIWDAKLPNNLKAELAPFTSFPWARFTSFE
jgi:uncharacterized protein YjbI with pentapeptide repeats